MEGALAGSALPGRADEHAAAYPRLTGKIASGENLFKTGGFQQGLHGVLLVVTVLQQQPAAGYEMCRGAGDDDAQVVETIGAGGQCLLRLEAQIALLQVVIGRCNVGRVRDDQIETWGDADGFRAGNVDGFRTLLLWWLS